MTRLWGVDDKLIEERGERLREQTQQAFDEQMYTLHRHALNKYPARIIDITEELNTNRKLRREERQALLDERRWKQEAVREAREYFRKKEEE